MFDNPKIREFAEKLEAEGCTLRTLWLGKEDPRTKAPDLGVYAVVGSGRSPKVGTIVIRDYGENGFGLWMESPSVSIDADVRAIVYGR